MYNIDHTLWYKIMKVPGYYNILSQTLKEMYAYFSL